MLNNFILTTMWYMILENFSYKIDLIKHSIL